MLKILTICTAGFLLLSQPARAAIEYNQNVTSNVIMGTGIGNGSFTTDRGNGIELGLRGKLRYPVSNTYNSNGDGTYSFAAGVAPGESSPTGIWSYEWSINSNYDGNGANLSTYDYVLSRDSDPSLGVNFAISVPFDPIASPGDHSFGNNSTLQSGGAEATSLANYGDLINDNNLAQNSWKAHWSEAIGATFDPTIDGTYDFRLEAFDGSVLLASTYIQVIVGAGGAVPEPASALVWSSIGIFGLVARNRRFRR